MTRKIWIVICIVTLGVLLAFWAVGCGPSTPVQPDPPDQPDQPVQPDPPRGVYHLPVATTMTGGAGYIAAGHMAATLNPLQDVFEVYPMSSAGAMENVLLVHSGQAKLGTGPDVQLNQGYLGVEPYKEAYPNVRRLFTNFFSWGILLVPADSDIQSYADVGKQHRVNIGLPAQTTRAFNNLMYEAMGVVPGEDFDYVQLSTGDAFDAIRDGIIDAAFQGIMADQASFLELSVAKDIRIVPLDLELFNKFNELLGGVMTMGEIPAGMFRGIDEPVPTYLMTNSYFANKDIPEDVIYELTKTYWENIEALGAVDASVSYVTLDIAVVNLDLPIHPGAERYFKEVGVMK